MRWKIIIVNAGIVLLVCLASYVLLATAVGDVVNDSSRAKSDAERAISAANAQLSVDALTTERWLAEQASTEAVRAVFAGGTADARVDAATAQASKIRDAAVGEAAFAKMPPSLVLFVDASGTALGRNGSNLMRGDKMVDAYPSLGASLKSGHTTSDIWLNKPRQEQMFASYAPVRGGDSGAVIGAIVIGTPMNDERLSRTSDLTSGHSLALGVPAGDRIELVAKSANTDQRVIDGLASEAISKAAAQSLTSAGTDLLDGAPEGVLFAASALGGYGKRAVLVAAVPASLVASVGALLWPLIAVCGIGILLVVAGGVMLGNYISGPIAEMEDGLLAIINGKADLRFEIEHPDLGGLVTRINSLLNALMDVPETDEDGRASVPAGPQNFE